MKCPYCGGKMRKRLLQASPGAHIKPMRDVFQCSRCKYQTTRKALKRRLLEADSSE